MSGANGSQVDEVAAPSTIIQDYKSLLESAWEIRSVAEARAETVRQELIRVATRLCAAELDQQRHQHDGWDVKALADLIVRHVGRQLDELAYLRSVQQSGETTAAQRQEAWQQQMQAAQTDLQNRTAELRQAAAQIEQLKRVNEGYEAQVTRLQRQLEDTKARLPLSEPTAPETTVDPAPALPAAEVVMPTDHAAWPDWLRDWSKTSMFGRDSELIRLLGSSVECRREKIQDLLAQETFERERGMGAEKRIIARLITDGYIEARPVKKLRAGNPPDLLLLTPRGLEAYRLLYGSRPRHVYEEYRARHKSDDQIFLVLETIDFFQHMGYEVERFPESSRLADSALFAPDLVVTRRYAERLCLEVETGSYASDRDRKWRVVASGTGGEINVVTQTRASMVRLRGEVQNIRYGQRVTIRLTNLEEAATLPEGASIWLEERLID